MPFPPTFYGLDTDRELARLRLGPNAQDCFVDVVEAGHIDAGQATIYSARSDAGSRRWYRMVQVLRERLHVELAWQKMDTGGCSLSLRPDGLVAIQVAKGTYKTGLPGYGPSFANPKGVYTVRAADINQMVMCDPLTGETMATVPHQSDTPPPWVTWFLMYYVDRTKDSLEVRSELSLLERLGADGRACTWGQRNVIRSMPFTDEPAIDLLPESTGDADIRRRA